MSRLVYGLATSWLVKTQRRRVDGFYAKCLRRILRIPSAFISRVSNQHVFDAAGVVPVSLQIEKQQLKLFGQVARSAEGNPMRQDVFVGRTLHPQIAQHIRRVGRPCLNWTEEVIRRGAARCGGHSNFERMVTTYSQVEWNSLLDRMFSRS